MMDITALRDECRRLVREDGLVDPYQIADQIQPLVTGPLAEQVMERMLPEFVKTAIRGLRNQHSGERNLPIFVPGKGWMDMHLLSAEDCDVVAASYEARAAENTEYAKQFRTWGMEMRKGHVVALGELASFKAMMSETTRRGLRAASARGTKLGAPNYISVETRDWMLEQWMAGVPNEELAERLNIMGVPRRKTTKPWDSLAVSRYCSQWKQRSSKEEDGSTTQEATERATT